MNGVRLAFSWLTVLPVRGPDDVDRAVAARAIRLAPVVGALLGGGAAALMWVLTAAGMGTVLAGFVTVGGLALATRGMHLDGLADTLDGLGCYGPPERAREVMKSGGVGAFGAAALVFVIAIQAFSFGALAESGRWPAIVLVVAVGRVAVVLACMLPAEAAPGSGFGVLVARTQSVPIALAWAIFAMGLSALAIAPYYSLGPLAVALALIAALFLTRHCVRRFGGLNGDILGAALELTVAIVAALATLHP
ncbi:adenosylcobinamide-GDP ribazoletransferase [Nocardia sp. NEAU-G5]|uniref:Adenosylcobinamide-GDP ribazoletransferase n=1 Tax=Nocardia albiluteola TaxID=2842303 RepID=A0ABS6B423_9NOCA|nr:adenosylcobinamide-GDP ribazoletransferase [Nocardia albiluteola]MBU3063988.1 adenosylcobinamide-GDP ribazoletransferase [Nocardia albiluteola]